MSSSSTGSGYSFPVGSRGRSCSKKAGYVAVLPGWRDDPQTVEEAKADQDVFAGKSVGQVADYVDGVE